MATIINYYEPTADYAQITCYGDLTTTTHISYSLRRPVKQNRLNTTEYAQAIHLTDLHSRNSQLRRPAKQNKIKAVFLDLDDTLFDHISTARLALKKLIFKYPLFAQIPFDKLCNTYFTGLEHLHKKLLLNKINRKEAKYENFKNYIN